MKQTHIEWTDSTWNPLRGCSRVSEGCRNCYAERVAYRFSGAGQPYEGLAALKNGHASWTGKVELVEKHLLDPLRWGPIRQYDADDGERYPDRSRRIFVNSMSDLFHESVPDEWIDRIFAVMALCPQHIFQVLTKRPARMHQYLHGACGRIADRVIALRAERGDKGAVVPLPHIQPGSPWWPLANVWLGVSVENQAAADERIPLLLQTPAAVRFISAEPLLGPVSIDRWLLSVAGLICRREIGGPLWPNLDWVICGGESGPGARPMHPDWARSLRDQCVSAGVPFFFKQWGKWKPICEMPESEYSALYRPNKKAPEGEEWRQPDLDETHGRRCMVPIEYMNFAGGTGLDQAFQSIDGHGGMTFFGVGKKAADSLLDGREWKQFPEVRA